MAIASAAIQPTFVISSFCVSQAYDLHHHVADTVLDLAPDDVMWCWRDGDRYLIGSGLWFAVLVLSQAGHHRRVRDVSGSQGR